MPIKGVVTPFEILSAQKRIMEDLCGLEKFKYVDSCVSSNNLITLLAKCISMKKRELDIIRKVLY